ncbi:hypothetical protein DM860_012835 [Cuscuta australis]|uniref:Cyclin-like domain-containing protein n=1 Tax=Cuscuta australis TaxID=267555 RepID=A0A328DUR5_9ASTE|nr:hypothetical protein DM860_012835 [Cuscuta australis]
MASPLTLPQLEQEEEEEEDDENEELASLFSKETESPPPLFSADPPLFLLPRAAAVRWILRVSSHYGFSALTPVLAVNYLDRFLSGVIYQEDKPWMVQLAAAACLSLAAKVEETHVPLLLDLQVEDAEHVFEAKTVQKMEIMVLSSLDWKMNPVTAISFVDGFAARLGLNRRLHPLHWEMFYARCLASILGFLPDSRFVRYVPSVVAAAAMLEVESSCNGVDYGTQLLSLLHVTKDKVNQCSQTMREVVAVSNSTFRRRHYIGCYGGDAYHCCPHHPGSPIGVIDAAALCCTESSDDDWWGSDTAPVTPSPPHSKKIRVE